MGFRVSQVKPSNCFRCLEKVVYLPFLTFIFHFGWCETCSYPTTVFNEIMRHFRGSKHTPNPPAYFQGVRTPKPSLQDLYSCFIHLLTNNMHAFSFHIHYTAHQNERHICCRCLLDSKQAVLYNLVYGSRLSWANGAINSLFDHS